MWHAWIQIWSRMQKYYRWLDSLVPRLHSPAFYRTVFVHSAIKSWGVESGNEAMVRCIYTYCAAHSPKLLLMLTVYNSCRPVCGHMLLL